MARFFDMSVFERHLEKVILGVAAVVFIYALFVWGVTSPNTIDLFAIPNEEKNVPPDQIDAKLAKTSSDLRERMKNLTPKALPLNNYSAILKKMQDGSGLERHFAIDFGSGRLPLAGTDRSKPTIKPVSVAKIEAVTPRPEIPCVMAGRELPRVEPPADQMVAHGVALYPWEELGRKWNAELAEAGISCRPVVLDVIAEYQEMRSDGTWPADNEARRVPLPAGDSARFAIPSFSGKNADEIEKIKAELQGKWQDKILQPEYPRVWLPETGWVKWWTNSQNEGANEVAELMESVAGATRGAKSPETPAAAPSVPAAPELRPVPAAPVPPARAPRPAAGVRPAGTGGRTSPEVSRPVPIAAPVVQLKFQDVEPALAIPSVEVQKRAKVLVWFHHVPLNTAVAYRYRVRLVLLNPLLGTSPKAVQSASDNTVTSIVTSPSEWSRPVQAFKGMEFFLTGVNRSLNKVNVNVFAHCLGQRVRNMFMVEVGHSIGDVKKVPVINPLTQKPVLVETDFGTGAVAVAFTFAQRYLKDNFLKESAQVLYLDEKGHLRSKIMAADEDSSLNRQLKKEAQATEDAAKAAK